MLAKMPDRFVRTRPGTFTIVELLVVIGIIAALIGLLLPALSGVRARGEKTTEINKLRQFTMAWGMYASSHNDAALPGYIDEETQELWDVVYRYPDKTNIPHNIAAPYTRRLFRYLDYSRAMVLGHADEDDPNVMNARFRSPTSRHWLQRDLRGRMV